MEKYEEKTKDVSSNRNITSVVNKPVQVRKKSPVGNLVNGDIGKIGKDLATDILIPSFKKVCVDLVNNGIQLLLYGEVKNKTKNGYVAYNKVGEERHSSIVKPSKFDIDDIVFDSIGEAEIVLDSMEEIIEQYDSVSVSDLYELVGVKGNYTSNKYGWTSLRSARVVRDRDGYILDLPRVKPLD